MSLKKLKKALSVIVVEDHNDALQHIYRAIGSKRIPFKNGAMIHFDSHPDLMIPKKINRDNIYDKEHVLSSLSIENWIMPAIFAGHFSNIAWIKPPWATQLSEGLHNFKIGVDKSGEIKVTCTEPYFVSELAWCDEEDLENPLPVTLEVCTLGNSLKEEASAGAPSVKPCSLNPELKNKLEVVPYVLDIDLDFYSTRNPFLSMFSEEQFQMLRELYHYKHPEQVTKQSLLEVTSNRKQQLSELESFFKNIEDQPTSISSARLESARRLLATFPGGEPPDPGLLNDAGCTCDDCDLPHHVSTPDQVRHLVEETKDFLKTLPPPAIITIARSSQDDYCPPEDVDFIQELVLQMLKDIYFSIDVKIDYEEIPELVPAVST